MLFTIINLNNVRTHMYIYVGIYVQISLTKKTRKPTALRLRKSDIEEWTTTVIFQCCIEISFWTKYDYKEKLKEQFSKATGTLPEVAKAFIWGLCKELEASQGIFYVAKTREDGVHILTMVASYAYHLPETSKLEFEFGFKKRRKF